MQQASGGARWDSIHTLHYVTSAVSGGETVQQDHWEDVATGRYRVKVVTSVGVREVGYDGVTSWRQGPSGIAYTLGDVDSALVAADESFRVARGWWFQDRHAATVAWMGIRRENGQNYDVLSITPEGGRAFEAWLDHDTHLLARTDEQQAEDRVVTTYSDYRSVSGLMIPFTVRSGDGSDPRFDEVETVKSVEIDAPTSDNLYSIPPLPASDIVLPPGQNSVELKFRLAANNRILVPVRLNGKVNVEAEFDSGGSLLVQPKTVANLGVRSGGQHRQGGGGEGVTTSTRGTLGSIQIGAAKIRNLSFHSFAFHPDEPDEALVGLEVLQRFVVRFNFDRMVMTLIRPNAFHYTGSSTVVPFHFQDNQPEVKGSVDGIAGLFTIDTGDNGSLLLIAPFARRFALVERYRGDIPYDGRAVGQTHGVWARKRAGTVILDGADGRPAVTVHDPVTRISLQHSGFDADRNVSGNIGLGILRQFNLTFDYPRQRIIFEPNHFYGQRDIYNRTGFSLQRIENGWSITRIYADSPAAAAGLQIGDVIMAIDGKTSEQLGGSDLLQVLKGASGHEVLLQVQSGSTTRTVTLVLRDVF